MPRRCLLVFAKPPIAGEVKTRLQGTLSTTQAAELHRALLLDLVERVGHGSFDVELWWARSSARDEELRALPGPHEIQASGDLGARMADAVTRRGASYDKVAVVGSDLPQLDRDLVHGAFEALGSAEIVIGPASDGGYYLIGGAADALDSSIFEGIEWGTSAVLQQTLSRCAGLSREVTLLAEVRDVDRPEDLEWLQAELESGAIDSRRAWAVLRALGGSTC
ncbi:MAG: TIGR04282 family arsenosugar biosynthesis glycosyltransferase [Acidobacteriota bacterium]|nr:TIGR04282 family arsenosugar biosynthesis glycosyltransferase [Acidobacteriota bacterium]